jgi:hypothetical protein
MKTYDEFIEKRMGMEKGLRIFGHGRWNPSMGKKLLHLFPNIRKGNRNGARITAVFSARVRALQMNYFAARENSISASPSWLLSFVVMMEEMAFTSSLPFIMAILLPAAESMEKSLFASPAA